MRSSGFILTVLGLVIFIAIVAFWLYRDSDAYLLARHEHLVCAHLADVDELQPDIAMDLMTSCDRLAERGLLAISHFATPHTADWAFETYRAFRKQMTALLMEMDCQAFGWYGSDTEGGIIEVTLYTTPEYAVEAERRFREVGLIGDAEPTDDAY